MKVPDRHKYCEALIERLRHLSASEQEEALKLECADDLELYDEVARRLRSLNTTDADRSLVDSRQDDRALPQEAATIDVPEVEPATIPPGEETPTVPPELGDEMAAFGQQPGTVIAGRYTLIEMIGEGGMGEVWVAEQTEPVRRRVALKLIKAGMDSKSVLARFEQERQALAMMEHPNIARVLDGGLTPNRQPFFVMELVEGRPLTNYCDKARLTLRERLELFIPICQAIQHAHQKGIVHRDLKPANILVAEENGRPLPKVIDFGVAKATGGKLTDHTLDTQMGAVVGTLEYMSPEQAGYGKYDVDTRADIYTLGVILFELLTGRRPFDTSRLKSAGMFEIVRMIVEDEPTRPSTRLSEDDSLAALAASRNVDARRFVSLVRGDLDWIVMKCLEKERDRRYETANALSRDVERYLSDEPIDARPPSAGYRLRKFFQRNRATTTAAAIVMMALLGGIVGTSIGLVRESKARAAEQRQRRRAELAAEQESIERRRAEDVATLMETMFDGISPTVTEEFGLSFEEQMVAKIEKMADALESYTGDSESRVRLEESFGRTLVSLSDFDRAQVLLEDAVEVRKASLGADHPETEQVMLGLAGIYQQKGEFEKALSLINKIRDRVKARPKVTDRELGDLDHMAGMIYQGSGQVQTAIELFEESRARIEKDPDYLIPEDRWLVLHTLGAAYREVGRIDESIRLLEKVLAGRTELFGQDFIDTYVTANSLATTYSTAGRLEDSRELYEATLERALKRYSPDNGIILTMSQNLAVVLGKLGEKDKALEMLDNTYELSVAKLGSDNPYTQRVQIGLASAYHNLGRNEEAIELLKDSIQTLTDKYGENYVQVFFAKSNLATCLRAKGELDEAIALMEEAIEGISKVQGRESYATIDNVARLALLYRIKRKTEQAIQLFNEVLEFRRSRFGEDNAQTLEAMHGLGCCYFDQGKSAEAIELFQVVLERRRALLGVDEEQTLDTQGSLAAAYWSARQYDKSVPLYEETLAQTESQFGASHGRTTYVATNLLVNYRDAGQVDRFYEAAKKWLPALMEAAEPDDQAVGMLTQAFLLECQKRSSFGDASDVLELICKELTTQRGENDPSTMFMVNNLGASYWQGGKFTKAISLYRKLIERSESVLGERDPSTIQRKGSLARCLIDDGQYAEAARLLEDALSIARDEEGTVPRQLEFMQRDLMTACAFSGQEPETLKAVDEFVKLVRDRYPAESSELASNLAHVGIALLKTSRLQQAEEILREALELRQRLKPDAWQTYSTKSVLGEVLLRNNELDEARSLLSEGYTGLIQHEDEIPVIGLQRLKEAIERLIRLAEVENNEEDLLQWQREMNRYQERYDARVEE